jgi:predicted neuraminidase
MFIYDKAPYPSCHASTIVEAAPGLHMAAWFGGTAEKAKDVQIWGAHFDGQAWSTPVVLGTEPNQPTWNPVLFNSPKGLILWYKAGPSPDDWTGYMRRSSDNGKTWTKPTVLPASMVGPVRAKPIRLKDGSILAGTSWESYKTWTPFVDRSTDDGETWLRSNAFGVKTEPHGGQIQPTLWQADDGSIVTLMRSRRPLNVCRSVSTDGGKTFSLAEPTTLSNPNAGIDAVKTREGDVFLIYNPAPIGRTPISLARSTDDGKSWTKVKDLETEFGEYSYPAMIQSSDGMLRMTYTWRRTHIKFVQIDPKTLR